MIQEAKDKLGPKEEEVVAWISAKARKENSLHAAVRRDGKLVPLCTWGQARLSRSGEMVEYPASAEAALSNKALGKGCAAKLPASVIIEARAARLIA